MKLPEPTQNDPTPLETRVLAVTDALARLSLPKSREILGPLDAPAPYQVNQAYRDMDLLQEANRTGKISDQDLRAMLFISSRMLHRGATIPQQLVFQEACHLLRGEEEEAARIRATIETLLDPPAAGKKKKKVITP